MVSQLLFIPEIISITLSADSTASESIIMMRIRKSFADIGFLHLLLLLLAVGKFGVLSLPTGATDLPGPAESKATVPVWGLGHFSTIPLEDPILTEIRQGNNVREGIVRDLRELSAHVKGSMRNALHWLITSRTEHDLPPALTRSDLHGNIVFDLREFFDESRETAANVWSRLRTMMRP